MITYIQAQDMAGYSELPNAPVRKFEYYAYKNGVVRKFEDYATAYAYSSMVESILLNTTEIIEWRDRCQAVDEEAARIWKAALRQEFAHLSDAIFKVCYEEAEARYDCAGHDEVAAEMVGVVNFAGKVLASAPDRN
jgi:hypothetical protein